jgi:hypothetical protein
MKNFTVGTRCFILTTHFLMFFENSKNGFRFSGSEYKHSRLYYATMLAFRRINGAGVNAYHMQAAINTVSASLRLTPEQMGEERPTRKLHVERTINSRASASPTSPSEQELYFLISIDSQLSIVDCLIKFQGS